jgi:hypothetical protein
VYWERAWCLAEVLFGKKARAKRPFPEMYKMGGDGLTAASYPVPIDPNTVRTGQLTDERDRPKINFLALQSKLI